MGKRGKEKGGGTGWNREEAKERTPAPSRGKEMMAKQEVEERATAGRERSQGKKETGPGDPCKATQIQRCEAPGNAEEKGLFCWRGERQHSSFSGGLGGRRAFY